MQLLRINCLAQVMFAASFALGEFLVADRRFLFYALAPILYRGIIVGTVLFARPIRDRGHRLGAVAGAVAHLGDPRDRHDPDLVPDQPGLRGPDCGLWEFSA